MPTENSARYCHSTTVAALSPTFGFGACTNPPRDLINSDCILIMGSNMGEAHPVAFHWPMEAKRKGAITIHGRSSFHAYLCGHGDHYVTHVLARISHSSAASSITSLSMIIGSRST